MSCITLKELYDLELRKRISEEIFNMYKMLGIEKQYAFTKLRLNDTQVVECAIDNDEDYNVYITLEIGEKYNIEKLVLDRFLNFIWDYNRGEPEIYVKRIIERGRMRASYDPKFYVETLVSEILFFKNDRGYQLFGDKHAIFGCDLADLAREAKRYELPKDIKLSFLYTDSSFFDIWIHGIFKGEEIVLRCDQYNNFIVHGNGEIRKYYYNVDMDKINELQLWSIEQLRNLCGEANVEFIKKTKEEMRKIFHTQRVGNDFGW